MDTMYITAAAAPCDAELKKEMGLRHVSGDYNHRKQERNCLEYTGPSEMRDTRGAGRRREREGDGWNRDEREGERFVA